MKYPVRAVVDTDAAYPYLFRFDLVEPSPGRMPIDQIPELKAMVNDWLFVAGMEYIYRQGLCWCLKNEQDAVLFTLRFL